MNIPPIRQGHQRQWVACKTCGRVAHYDYVPYSLSNPIMTMPCGHDLGRRWENAVQNISADEALIRIAEQQKAA